MRSVGGTADGIRDKHDAKAAVDGAKHRREHANIGLAAGDEQCIDVRTSKQGVELPFSPRRIDALVDQLRRRDETRKRSESSPEWLRGAILRFDDVRAAEEASQRLASRLALLGSRCGSEAPSNQVPSTVVVVGTAGTPRTLC